MEKLLNESDLLDTRLKNQISYVQKVRQCTIDAISDSESVVNTYQSAQSQFKLKIENKKVENMGNNNFIKGVIRNDAQRKRDSIDMSKDVCL